MDLLSIVSIFLHVFTVILAIILANYNKIDNYKDRRKKGFWKSLKPQGRYIFIMAVVLCVLQILLYSANHKRISQKSKIIEDLKNAVNEINYISKNDFESNGPNLLIEELTLTDSSIFFLIHNVGERVADSLNLSVCIAKVNEEDLQIKSKICPHEDRMSLSDDERIFAGKFLKLNYPIRLNNISGEYSGNPLVAEIEIEFYDKPTNRKLFYKRVFVWLGYEQDRYSVKPAPKYYYNVEF